MHLNSFKKKITVLTDKDSTERGSWYPIYSSLFLMVKAKVYKSSGRECDQPVHVYLRNVCGDFVEK